MIRLTREQVRELDRRSIQDYGIPGIVLMENAAQAVTREALDMLKDHRPHDVLILCGPGNNGGDGLAVARHLHNAGVQQLQVLLIEDPGKYKDDAAINWRIVSTMKLPVITQWPEQEPGLIIDAMYGTGLSHLINEPTAALIEKINQSPASTLAVDIPTGLDCDNGQPAGACVRADRTVTFAAEKAGFALSTAKIYTGDILIGDIGCPKELIEAVAGGG